jgi:hypothetical protein
MDGNATHPNAYRAEAQEKLAEAARLTSEAEALEAQANELEGIKAKPAAAEQSPEDKKKLFHK